MIARVECAVCTHQWVATFPMGEDPNEIECPHCHDRDSEVQEYIDPPGRVDEDGYYCV